MVNVDLYSAIITKVSNALICEYYMRLCCCLISKFIDILTLNNTRGKNHGLACTPGVHWIPREPSHEFAYVSDEL